jgi:4-nitrophenyl phosphatase
MAAWPKDRSEYAKLIEKYDTFLFDCDGVLWNGDQVIPGAAEVLGYLRSKRKLDNCDVTKAAALMAL